MEGGLHNETITFINPSYFLFGCAWFQTLQIGIEGAGSFDQDEIKEYFGKHTIETIAGSLTFDEKGLPEPYAYLTQVQQTGVELIWPEEVRTSDPIYPKPDWA